MEIEESIEYIVGQSERARIIYEDLREASDEKILNEITRSGLSTEGGPEGQRYRLLRFGLIDTEDKWLVSWNAITDEAKIPSTGAKKKTRRTPEKPRKRAELPRSVKGKKKEVQYSTDEAEIPKIDNTPLLIPELDPPQWSASEGVGTNQQPALSDMVKDSQDVAASASFVPPTVGASTTATTITVTTSTATTIR